MKSFATLRDAYEWCAAECDHDCVDNYRHATAGNAEQEAAYREAQNDGCCGFFDRVVLVAGVETWVGCNYGH